MTPEEQITQEMSIENLIVILKAHSEAVKNHEKQLENFARLYAALLEGQQTTAKRLEVLKNSVEDVQKLLLRAIPRQGAGPEAN